MIRRSALQASFISLRRLQVAIFSGVEIRSGGSAGLKVESLDPSDSRQCSLFLGEIQVS